MKLWIEIDDDEQELLTRILAHNSQLLIKIRTEKKHQITKHGHYKGDKQFSDYMYNPEVTIIPEKGKKGKKKKTTLERALYKLENLTVEELEKIIQKRQEK